MGDLCKVDIITIVDYKCIKIQVKNLASINSNNLIPFSIHKSGPNYEFTYTKKDVDVFACLLPNDKVIYVGWDDLKGKNGFVFRINKTKMGKQKV